MEIYGKRISSYMEIFEKGKEIFAPFLVNILITHTLPS